MLSHVQLRDFKPDVVICPHCTQHLMGVKDVQWAADRVSFTYGCAGCGHEIDRPVGDDVFPAALSSAKMQQAKAPQAPEPAEDITPMDDLGPFPFRKLSEPSRPFALKADDDASVAGSSPMAEHLADDLADDDDIAEEHDEPAPFGSMRLLPPQPSWMETAPVFIRRATAEERPALTPKQVFDIERRPSDRLDGPLPDAAVVTRASVLLRDVSIF
jgi:hypothetical protein